LLFAANSYTGLAKMLQLKIANLQLIQKITLPRCRLARSAALSIATPTIFRSHLQLISQVAKNGGFHGTLFHRILIRRMAAGIRLSQVDLERR
jgi:surface polysaccharide O-acyltransferase-like enzyme